MKLFWSSAILGSLGLAIALVLTALGYFDPPDNILSAFTLGAWAAALFTFGVVLIGVAALAGIWLALTGRISGRRLGEKTEKALY